MRAANEADKTVTSGHEEPDPERCPAWAACSMELEAAGISWADWAGLLDRWRAQREEKQGAMQQSQAQQAKAFKLVSIIRRAMVPLTN
jgi:hypothetical protein